MKDQARDKRSLIIAGAAILTLILLGIFGLLLANGAEPDDCQPGAWLLEQLVCLEPNELGDTFAGAFAPVAFVWLVAAVMLQRNELAAQRQELRESRLVSAEQVAEARKNVALIEQQTSMLKRQREIDEERRADQHVNLLIDVALNSASTFRGAVVFKHVGTAYNLSPMPLTDDNASNLRTYIDQLAQLAARAKALDGENGPVELADPELVKQLFYDLGDLHHTSNQASAPVKAKVRQARIRVGRIACDTLLKYSNYIDDEDLVAAIFNNDP